ncbi:Rps22bp [Colletotrichum scovillei]|nr:Rps22bp [Colletotrichum scovillei]
MAPGTSSRNTAQMPRLFSESELRRFEDCANENQTLADCWAGEQIVIVACELSDRYQYADQRNSRAIEINVMSPADKSIWRSLPLDDKKHDAFKKHCSTRTIRMLEKSKVNKSLQPKPWSWYNVAAAHETFELYEDEARAKAQETFDALGGQAYATVCVVSYDLRETMAALELFKVKLPSSKVVFVDLIKVLEHQTRGEGVIPEQLRKQHFVSLKNLRFSPSPIINKRNTPKSCDPPPSALSDALKIIDNAEKQGQRQVVLRPSSKVIVKFLQLMQQHGHISDFEEVDDHRGGKIVVQLTGRLKKCGVISPRFNVRLGDLEKWVFGHVVRLVLTTSAGIMDHNQARRKNASVKILGYFY